MGEKLVQLVVEDPTYISSSEGCPTDHTDTLPNTRPQTLTVSASRGLPMPHLPRRRAIPCGEPPGSGHRRTAPAVRGTLSERGRVLWDGRRRGNAASVDL